MEMSAGSWRWEVAKAEGSSGVGGVAGEVGAAAGSAGEAGIWRILAMCCSSWPGSSRSASSRRMPSMEAPAAANPMILCVVSMEVVIFL